MSTTYSALRQPPSSSASGELVRELVRGDVLEQADRRIGLELGAHDDPAVSQHGRLPAPVVALPAPNMCRPGSAVT